MTRRALPLPDGTPAWIELACADAGASAAFCVAALGWRFAGDMPGVARPGSPGVARPGSPGVPLVATAAFGEDWLPVCGLTGSAGGARGREQEGEVVTVHLASGGLEATLVRVAAAGGSVLHQGFEEAGAVPVALCRDPLGVVFGLRQALAHPGFGAFWEPGFPAWFELRADDPEAAAAFYTAALGLDFVAMAVDGQPMWMNRAFAITGRPPTVQEAAGWQVSLFTEDLDESLRRALAAGARIVQPRTVFTHGVTAAILSPQGLRLGFFQPAE